MTFWKDSFEEFLTKFKEEFLKEISEGIPGDIFEGVPAFFVGAMSEEIPEKLSHNVGTYRVAKKIT